MKFFDEIAVGERFALGAHTFTAEEIKHFARRFDPQPFHLDEEAAARSHFGALCASGWHTAATWMRLMVADRRRQQAEMRARGERVPLIGPSPGLRALRWLRPVHAGDTITYSSVVVETRRSNSRPGWGLITLRAEGVNQRGEDVLSFLTMAFIERRPD